VSLIEYQHLDFSGKGPLAQDLFEQLDVESGQQALSLTAPHDADVQYPPYLTPKMQNWYRTYVATVRGAALEEIKGVFNAITPGRGLRGFLLEAERDRIKSETVQSIKSERTQFFNNPQVQQVSADLEEAQRDYDAMRKANGGDDANEWTMVKYVALLLLLAIPEIPLNFQSFAKFRFMTPAMAMASVVIVAGAIAVSSHIFGMSLKQWTERFGPQVPNKTRYENWRLFSFGWFLFAVVFGIIFTGRSLLFQEEVERKLALGEILDFTDYMAFGFTVGGNFLIWTLGSVAAYFAHSRVPDFGRKEKKVNDLKARLAALFRKDLQARIGRHLSKEQVELANIEKRSANELRDHPELVAVRGQFETLKKYDSQVLALLETYRSQLLDRIRKRTGAVTFYVDDIGAQTRDMRVALDISQYESTRLRLPYA